MAKEDVGNLLPFLKPFRAEKADLLLWLRDFAWGLCPEASELIYDNYNALAIGWSPTGRLGHTVCSVAVMRGNQNIHFGFYWGSVLSDPDRLLLGKGNQYRYLLVADRDSFPLRAVEKLVNEAYVNALARVKDPRQLLPGQTLIKSVTDKKRPVK